MKLMSFHTTVVDDDGYALLLGDQVYREDVGRLTLGLSNGSFALFTHEGVLYESLSDGPEDKLLHGFKHIQSGKPRAVYHRHGPITHEGRSTDTVLFKTVAQAKPPFGPGLGPEEMTQIEKIEQYVSTETPDGQGWVEFALYNNDDQLIERRRFYRNKPKDES